MGNVITYETGSQHRQKGLNTPTVSPTERFIGLLKNPKEYARGVKAYCPAHHDSKESLMVWEDEVDHHVGVKCFAGCTRKQIVEAVGLTESDLYVPDKNAKPGRRRPLIDVCDLGIDKSIHPRDLAYLGLIDGAVTYQGKDGTPYTKKGVIIPYYTADGKPYERYRLRTALKAKDGSAWNEGKAPIIPYGLHRLKDARKAKQLVLVEGESDCWTLWLQRFPALGIPGAMMASSLQQEHLEGIEKIFIIQEPPSEKDKEQGKDPGKAFVETLDKRLKALHYTGRVYALDFKEATGEKDPNDLHKKDIKGFKQAFDTALLRARPVGKDQDQAKRPRPKIVRLADLQEKTYEPVKWAVPEILPEGLTLLCGKPKLGKSWMLLSMMCGIATGSNVLGNVAVEQGDVLYLALEDNERRLTERSNILLDKAKASPHFYCVTNTIEEGHTPFPRLNEGGYEEIEEWLQSHPNARMVGIDTWARFKPRPQPGARSQQYDEDYNDLAPLQELAGKHKVSIVLVHHLRKLESNDPLDMITGSTAMQGAVDGFLLLHRKRGESDARLFIQARDLPDSEELLLTFQQESARWVIKGGADEMAGTPERQAILDVLRPYPEGLPLKEIAEKLGKNPHTTRNLIVPLRAEGKIILKNNLYKLTISIPSNPSNPSRSSMPSNPSRSSVEAQSGYYANPSTYYANPPSYYANSETIVTPCDGLIEQDEHTKKQQITRVTRHTTIVDENPSHTMPVDRPALEAKLARLRAAMQLHGKTTYFWKDPAGKGNSFLTPSEYINRARACILSGNRLIADEALEDIEKKLNGDFT